MSASSNGSSNVIDLTASNGSNDSNDSNDSLASVAARTLRAIEDLCAMPDPERNDIAIIALCSAYDHITGNGSKKRKRMPSYERPRHFVPEADWVPLAKICDTCGEPRDNGPSDCADACDGPGGEGCECHHHNGSKPLDSDSDSGRDSPPWEPIHERSATDTPPYHVEDRGGDLGPYDHGGYANGSLPPSPRTGSPRYVPTSPCIWFEPSPYTRNGCLSPIWDEPDPKRTRAASV